MGVHRTVGSPLQRRGTRSNIRHHIEQLGPYQSLVLLAVPTSIVEPLKLAAVAVAGEGHWITGTVMIIVAYGCSFLFVERLFQIVKPKLLTLPWFARLWNYESEQSWLVSFDLVDLRTDAHSFFISY